MTRNAGDLLHGTVDVLILKTLTWGPQHGYAIAEWLRAQSGGSLLVDGAALYQALHRLNRRGSIVSEWGVSDNNRRARFYRLTPAGRAALRAEVHAFRDFARAVLTVLDVQSASR